MINYSIVVPAYDAGKTLPHCLTALQHQSIDRACYEVIVVDDGSRDQTATIAEQARLEQPNVRLIRAAHGGPANARNLGARAAQGELILFTDADCEPAADWIERMAAAFDDPQVAGAKGTYRTCQSSPVARFVQQEYQDKFDRMIGQPSIDFIDTFSAAYRREIFLSNGGFDPTFIMDEDQELSFRLSALGYKLVFAPGAIVSHQHVDTLGQYLRRKYGIGYWKALVLRRYPGKAVRDSHTPQIIKLQMGLLMMSFITALTAVLAPETAGVAIGAWLLLLLTMLPVLGKIARRDPGILWITPLMIGLRALGLGVGLVVGLIRFALNPAPATYRS